MNLERKWRMRTIVRGCHVNSLTLIMYYIITTIEPRHEKDDKFIINAHTRATMEFRVR